MSDISVRGYVNRPQARTGSKGGFSTFTLSEKQKNKPGEEPTRNFFNVTDFENGEPPEDGAFVTVTGYLKFRKYTHNGQERVSYDVVAKSVVPYEGGGNGPSSKAASEPSDAKDPWDE